MTKNIQVDFDYHIQNKLPFLMKSKLLIAISGGVDSVVLAYLCSSLNLNITLAHCNFNLRGSESDTDEQFVFELAEKLDLELFIEHFDTAKYATHNNLSIQMAARELRYNWFNELAQQLNFDYILTGHHADDNLETFFINLMRGTGLEGLTGIPETNHLLVRPLLPFSRLDLKEYAESNQISWRDDSSNASTKYLRNKLRHDVIPILKEMNPQLLQSFQKTQGYLQDATAIINDRVNAVRHDVEKESDGILKLEIAKLLKYANPKAYLYQLLKVFNFTEWDDVYGLLTAQSGKFVVSNTHRLLKDREFLIVSEISTPVESTGFLIAETDAKLDFSNAVLTFETVTKITESSSSTIFVDKDLLNYPLRVSKWEKGAYFYPFGMSGKKKVSKYFKDEKLSLLEKEQVWFLYSESEIVWLIGLRADNQFRVTNKTKNILKISLHNES
ncbi:tRNA lysidine(34) synthetase TilS [Bizionia sp. KMM 8389]